MTARSEGDVLVSVKDNGIGVPPAMLPHIFDLFAQVEKNWIVPRGALEIGLTVARSLAEMHGGKVTAVSDGPGKGSEFMLSLPRAAAAAVSRPVNSTGQVAPGVNHPLRILIADDNVDSANGLAKLLVHAGCVVTLAHDGPTAMELARSQQPDILLLDIGLPGADGYQIARQLRQEKCGRHAMIVAVSGYAQDQDRRRSQEAGFDHHFVKPLNFDSLFAVLANRPAR